MDIPNTYPRGSFVTLHWYPNRPKHLRLVIAVINDRMSTKYVSPSQIPEGFHPFLQIYNLTFPQTWLWT
jgi:hypothetical protein